MGKYQLQDILFAQNQTTKSEPKCFINLVCHLFYRVTIMSIYFECITTLLKSTGDVPQCTAVAGDLAIM